MDVELKGSLVETFRWRCQNTPDSTAIKFLDREQTYSQFNTHSVSYTHLRAHET